MGKSVFGDTAHTKCSLCAFASCHLAEAFLLLSSLYIVFVLPGNYFKHFCAIFLPQWVTIPPCHIKSLTGENRASQIHAQVPRYPDTTCMPSGTVSARRKSPLCVYQHWGAKVPSACTEEAPCHPSGLPCITIHGRCIFCPASKYLKRSTATTQ